MLQNPYQPMGVRADPYQPMMIRSVLAPGSSCPGCFPPYKHVHRTMFLNNSIGSHNGWVESIGPTTTCVAARPILSTIMRSSLANSSSVRLAFLCSSSFMKLSTLCFDISFSDIEISFFNAFTCPYSRGSFFRCGG